MHRLRSVVTRIGPLLLMGLVGCAAGSPAARTEQPDQGEAFRPDVAAFRVSYPVSCPEGARAEERVADPWGRPLAPCPGRACAWVYERACVRDGRPDGPYVVVSATGPRVDAYTLATWNDGELRGEASYAREGEVWSKQIDCTIDRADVVSRVHNANRGVVTEADLAGGTGTWETRGPDGAVRARGSCREGLWDGVWSEGSSTQTFRAGKLEGWQSTSGGEGMVRRGKRLGVWTFARSGECVHMTPPGSMCGFTRCDVYREARVVVVRYPEEGEPELLDVRPAPDADATHFDLPSALAEERRALPPARLPDEGARSCRAYFCPWPNSRAWGGAR